MKREIVDRIENGIAVLVDWKGKSRNVDLDKLPGGVREGDVLVNGRLNKYETDKTKASVRNLLKEIFKND